MHLRKMFTVKMKSGTPPAPLFLKLALVAIVVLININGCRRDVVDNVHPGPNEVWLQNIAYNPPTITVKAGTTITWTNKDGTDHTVTSTKGVFDSGIMHDMAVFNYTFTSAGSFPYLCLIHGAAMSGTVIVE